MHNVVFYRGHAQLKDAADTSSNWWQHFGFLCLATVSLFAQTCNGHGRLIEPPSRASAWRYGFQTPPDYNDHELYCGGFTRQWKRNEGKCGECGDAWDLSEPRPHEHGGQWGQGVIVRRYSPASEITIRVELTASHMGYFEFRVCPQPNGKQDCLDKYLLHINSGAPAVPSPSDLDTRFYPRNGSRIYEMKAQLPDIECSQCLLQWRYIAGNNWGMCPDGNGAVGCGPQEEFRSCSDIAIGEGSGTTYRPLRPTYRTTVRPKVSTSSTESTQPEETSTEESDYSSLFIAIFFCILFAAILAFAWYLYRYRHEQFKAWLDVAGNRLCRKQVKTAPMMNNTPHASIVATPVTFGLPTKKSFEQDTILSSTPPPVPPPRTKRQARIEELLPTAPSVS